MKSKFPLATFSINEVAKITRFPGGGYKLFEWLRKQGYLLLNNQPSQFQIDRNWFTLVYNSSIKNPAQSAIPVTRVTTIGLAGLEKVINKQFPICKPCEEQSKNLN